MNPRLTLNFGLALGDQRRGSVRIRADSAAYSQAWPRRAMPRLRQGALLAGWVVSPRIFRFRFQTGVTKLGGKTLGSQRGTAAQFRAAFWLRVAAASQLATIGSAGRVRCFL